MKVWTLTLTPLEFKELGEALRLAKNELSETDGDEDVIEYLTNALEILNGNAEAQSIDL